MNKLWSPDTLSSDFLSVARLLRASAEQMMLTSLALLVGGPLEAAAYQLPTADQGRRKTRTECAPHSMECGLSRA
jgi:hypothetical protein